MCYILNPTEKMLKSWYKCNKYVADYLITKCGMINIYIDKNEKYYFVKSQCLLDNISKLPLHIKLMKLL
jgi:hypothetical protein